MNLCKDEEIGTEQERGHEAAQVTLKANKAEEETWTMQMNKSDRRRGPNRDERKRKKNAEERDERRRGRKKRSKKRGDRVRKKRSSKDLEPFEEKTTSQAQEVLAATVEEERQAVAVSESPSVELTNSCDLSDPIFVGCGGAEQYGSTLPAPLLYSSQSLVPIQPGPPPPPPDTAPPPAPLALAPQLHETKRPHSPALPRGLPQPPPQPLEVRPRRERIINHYSTQSKMSTK